MQLRSRQGGGRDGIVSLVITHPQFVIGTECLPGGVGHASGRRQCDADEDVADRTWLGLRWHNAAFGAELASCFTYVAEGFANTRILGNLEHGKSRRKSGIDGGEHIALHFVASRARNGASRGDTEVDDRAHAVIVGFANSRYDLFPTGIGRLAPSFANHVKGVIKQVLLVFPEIGGGRLQMFQFFRALT